MFSDEQIKDKIIEIGRINKVITSVDARKAFLGSSQPVATNKIVQIFNELQVLYLFIYLFTYTITNSLTILMQEAGLINTNIKSKRPVVYREEKAPPIIDSDEVSKKRKISESLSSNHIDVYSSTPGHSLTHSVTH